jgi:hypothetical protein
VKTPAFATAPAPTSDRPADARRAELILWLIVAGAVLACLVASTRNIEPAMVVGAVALPMTIVAAQRVLLAWQTLLGLILAVILFIPIRRYTLGGGLPFELEPYRLLIAVVLGCWFCALLADPKVRWRPTGFAAPILTLVVAMGASLALNLPRVDALGGYVVKQVTFFVSYLLLIYFVRTSGTGSSEGPAPARGPPRSIQSLWAPRSSCCCRLPCTCTSAAAAPSGSPSAPC